MKEKKSNEQTWRLFVVMLKTIAEEKQLTHEYIAEVTGFHRSNVTRFFRLSYCPNMKTFIAIAKAINVNFFFEDKDDTTDLTLIFEKAMTQIGRSADKLPPEILN